MLKKISTFLFPWSFIFISTISQGYGISSEIDPSDPLSLKLSLGGINNSSQVLSKPSNRELYEIGAAYDIDPRWELSGDLRAANDSYDGAHFEYFFARSRFQLDPYFGLHLDVGGQQYYSGTAFNDSAGNYVTSENQPLIAFVSGIGLERRFLLGDNWKFGLGTPFDANRNWDIFVNRMDGANNTASVLLPVSITSSTPKGSVESQVRVGFRKSMGGGGVSAETVALGSDLKFAVARSWQFFLNVEGSIPLKTLDLTNQSGSDYNTARIYEIYDNSASIGMITRF